MYSFIICAYIWKIRNSKGGSAPAGHPDSAIYEEGCSWQYSAKTLWYPFIVFELLSDTE